jgi:hypothetical protein
MDGPSGCIQLPSPVGLGLPVSAIGGPCLTHYFWIIGSVDSIGRIEAVPTSIVGPSEGDKRDSKGDMPSSRRRSSRDKDKRRGWQSASTRQKRLCAGASVRDSARGVPRLTRAAGLWLERARDPPDSETNDWGKLEPKIGLWAGLVASLRGSFLTCWTVSKARAVAVGVWGCYTKPKSNITSSN